MTLFYSLEDREQKAALAFLSQGYVIFKLEDLEGLSVLRDLLAKTAREKLGKNFSPEQLFDRTHEMVSKDGLNEFRVALIAALGAAQKEINPLLYRLATPWLHWLAGNELAMQRAPNLSIQLPQDESSLLPLHTDVWSGNSPYEVVFWLPLVDCHATKSMYLLPRDQSSAVMADFKKYRDKTVGELFESLKDRLVFLDVPYGHGVIFSHTLLHGNVVNREETTRWSINVRFKSLLSPYGDKELGETFMPVTLRPATRIGLDYKAPKFS